MKAMKPLVLLLAGMMLTAYCATEATAKPARGDVLYVAPDGHASACVKQVPCTLPTAIARVRRMLDTATSDITVELAAGTYPPFSLGEADSPPDGIRVSYRAAEGDRPIISGGMIITGWTAEGDGVFSAAVPAGLRSRQLYVNGVRAVRARSESGLPDMSRTEGGYQLSEPVDWTNPEDVNFLFRHHGNWSWNDQQCGVAKIEGTKITMDEPCWSRMTNSAGGVSWGTPGIIENVFEYLDQPGEWYLNEKSDRIYYLPRPGEDLGETQVVAATAEQLLSVRGRPGKPVRNITIQGLTFAYGTWLGPDSGLGVAEGQSNWMGCAGIHCTIDDSSSDMIPANVNFSGVAGIEIRDNLFTHLGGIGLAVNGGSSDTVVEGNELTDISGTNIQIGSYNDPIGFPSDADRDIQVINNYVHDTVREYLGGSPITVGIARGVTVAHNEVKNSSYSSVQMGWHTVKRQFTVQGSNRAIANDLSGAMTEMNDGGLLYINGKNTPGLPRGIATENWLHDVANGNALYIDDGASDIDAARNVISGNGKFETYVQTIAGQEAYGNTVIGNYTTDDGWGYNGAPSNFAVYRDHVIVRDGVWPEAAQSIMRNAGLEPGYERLRNPLPRRDWKITTSSGAPATAMIDGSISTRTRLGDTQQPGQWLSVDLGSVQRIAGVGLETLDNTYPVGYSAETSVDGRTWTQPVQPSRSVVSNLAADILRLSWQPVSARYLRVTQTGNGPRPWTIGELNINAERQVVIDANAPAVPIDAGFAGEPTLFERNLQGWHEFSITGQRVALYASTTPFRGVAAVSIDGGPAVDVDLYRPTVGNELVYVSPSLSYGLHKITITRTGRKNPNSSGTSILIDRIRTTRFDPGQRFVLISAASGLAATVYKGRLVQRPARGSDAQQFAIATNPDGSLRINLPGLPNSVWTIDEPPVIAGYGAYGGAAFRLTANDGSTLSADSVEIGSGLALTRWSADPPHYWYLVAVDR